MRDRVMPRIIFKYIYETLKNYKVTQQPYLIATMYIYYMNNVDCIFVKYNKNIRLEKIYCMWCPL